MSRKNTSQRVSGRKKRKPHHDDSDEISLTRHLDLFAKSCLENKTPNEGYRDLFGELIPPDVVSNEEAKNKSIKKTQKKKKQPREDDIVTKPKRVFIVTPKFMKCMMEAQKELYSLMGVSTSSSKVSVVSTDSLNVSGVQHLQDNPQISKSNESKINSKNNDNEKKNQHLLEGFFVFVDYKIDNERSASSIKERLISMGAKVEKTFNRKVTHVMFCDGYRSTYNKAVERNIPLLSARWMEYSYSANKMLDLADYPPVGMEKYTKPPPPRNIIIPKRSKYKKKVPDNVKREILFKSHCDKLMRQFNRRMKSCSKKKKKGPIIETPQKNTALEQHKFYNSIDVVQILSTQLRKELNSDVIPEPDEQVDGSDVPMSIRIIRKHLTPDVKEKTISKEVHSEISKIEDRLNLNFEARKKFRKLLFPCDKDLNNIEVGDFPTQTKDSDSRIMSLNSMNSMIQTPTLSLADNDIVLQSIAYTGMIKSEAKILKASIQNLGKFIFHTKVKPTTTYLITKSQFNQSLDIVFAMAYGCIIVSEDWVHKSFSIGKWLSHQQYLISDLSEPVKDFQIRRNTIFGSALKFNIFDNAGRIYISDSCESPAKLLRRLVHACGGHCTSTESIANVVVGYTLQMNNNIHEKWILDCITQGKLLNKCQYNLVNSNE
ncbi:uncharacterized protein LOC132933848 isoform X2 [Metopolophium dirhodum]|uniref:uncharacterized protein LOC132933848 isoform X2 n=1 Tax=Metopolophium dirhodum TaxID=44670 RepID=UPI0029900B82|nr:uncharacterized protein LOC132933848 isoform X2 [Metopolophium dirhodum]